MKIKMDGLVKSGSAVFPAQDGIQKLSILLDPGLRRGDDIRRFWTFCESIKIGLTIIFFLFIAGIGVASAEPLTYSTWDDLEVDKLASIWLLKTFITPDAKIKIYPKGQIIQTGVEFDTPYAKLSRRFNKSAFEVLVEHYKIKDEKLILLSKIIHDIEINVWQRKMFKESMQIDYDIMNIIDLFSSNEKIINKACSYFNDFYDKMIIK